MKVPINPSTNVPTGRLGYERAVDVTEGNRMLATVVNKYAEQEAEEQKKRELFDVQHLLLDEANNLEQDFEAKTKVQPLGAPNFTQQVNGEYNTRHLQMIKALRDRGYSDDAINEYETRLGVMRSQFVAKAIDFQDKSNFAKVRVTARNMADKGSAYAYRNPTAVQSVLDEYKTALEHSGLSAPEQLAVFEEDKRSILKSAQQGFAEQHPEIVVGLFAPNELTKPSITETTATSGDFNLQNYVQKLGPVEGTGKNPRSSARGFGQFLDSTWLGTYKEVYGDTGESNAQILAKKKDLTVATKLTERLTQDNIARLQDANIPINDTTVYLAHFLGVNDAVKVLSAHADETIKSLISPASIRSNPGVFKKVSTASDLVSWAQGKMGGDTAPAIKPIPANWKGNQEDAIQELGMTADQAKIYIETGVDTRGQQPSGAKLAFDQSGVGFDDKGLTGIAPIDLASGTDREEMLNHARVILNRRENELQAADAKAHDEWYNKFLNGLQDGTLSQTDLDQAYKSGQITDYSERMRAQGILDERNKVNKDLVLYDAMRQTNIKGNPFDKAQQDAVDAGFQRGVEYLAKHPGGQDPFTYALGIWQRNGILPTQAGVMLRGALVSTDPKQVLAAAAVASNMIQQNPNAFASVNGKEEIEHAAVNFRHYVFDLGMSPQDAANRVAGENDPAYKEKFKYNDPLAQESVKQLKQNGVNANQVFSDQGKFSSPETLAEGNQTYYSLIRDGLTRGLDLPTALAQAKAQMQKVYGPNRSGTIVKYPPERMYPQINGNWNYIYRDAGQTVKAETGRDAIEVNLIPIPGVTDQDFRNGTLPRYRLVYSYRAKDGHKIVDVVPGQFAADVNKARQEATARNREEFMKARAAITPAQAKKREDMQKYLLNLYGPNYKSLLKDNPLFKDYL